MLEMWLSKERLLSNSTLRFLTVDEESTEQPSSVRQCSRLFILWFLSPIINICFFQNLVVRNYSSSSFYIDYTYTFEKRCSRLLVICDIPGILIRQTRHGNLT